MSEKSLTEVIDATAKAIIAIGDGIHQTELKLDLLLDLLKRLVTALEKKNE